jgi:hypothetical protein
MSMAMEIEELAAMVADTAQTANDAFVAVMERARLDGLDAGAFLALTMAIERRTGWRLGPHLIP